MTHCCATPEDYKSRMPFFFLYKFKKKVLSKLYSKLVSTQPIFYQDTVETLEIVEIVLEMVFYGLTSRRASFSLPFHFISLLWELPCPLENFLLLFWSLLLLLVLVFWSLLLLLFCFSGPSCCCSFWFYGPFCCCFSFGVHAWLYMYLLLWLEFL